MFSRDLIERVVATFVQASLGAMASNSMFDLGVDQWKMMAGAGVAARLGVAAGAHRCDAEWNQPVAQVGWLAGGEYDAGVRQK